MGFPSQLVELSPGWSHARLNHAGLAIELYLDQDQWIAIEIPIGYLPKANVAPLFRRLLVLSTVMGGVFFCIGDNDNIVRLKITRGIDGLEVIELRWMLDQLSSRYFQYAPTLVQEFQLPMESP
jgi:hypothetical protein